MFSPPPPPAPQHDSCLGPPVRASRRASRRAAGRRFDAEPPPRGAPSPPRPLGRTGHAPTQREGSRNGMGRLWGGEHIFGSQEDLHDSDQCTCTQVDSLGEDEAQGMNNWIRRRAERRSVRCWARKTSAGDGGGSRGDLSCAGVAAATPDGWPTGSDGDSDGQRRFVRYEPRGDSPEVKQGHLEARRPGAARRQATLPRPLFCHSFVPLCVARVSRRCRSVWLWATEFASLARLGG